MGESKAIEMLNIHFGEKGKPIRFIHDYMIGEYMRLNPLPVVTIQDDEGVIDLNICAN